MNLHVLACVVAFWMGGVQARAELAPSVVAKDGSTMVLVPAGEFTMGTASDRDDATPVHKRVLPAYYIDQTEVTTEQYSRFVNETGTPPPPDWVKNGGKYSAPAGKEKLPITNITWFDAMRYAIWAGKRLPTEAEWEKAARGTDGRRFPWGNVDDLARRHMPQKGTSSTFHDIGPVGRFAAGASPCGCLDMSGNAWEWTADWYDKYPGTSARSVHFGKQYKVMRGGSGLGFYGQPNTGTCVERGRLVPYGAYDSLGFRCVVDAEAPKPAYEPAVTLKEAEDQLQGTLKDPVQLSYEKEFEQFKKAGRVPLSVRGMPGQQGHVRTGFPFPQGLLKDVHQIELLDATGKVVPVQTSALVTWKDGSVRWALLDFVARDNAAYEVTWAAKAGSSEAGSPVLEQTADGVSIQTGAATFSVSKSGIVVPGVGPMQLEMTADIGGKQTVLKPLPAEDLKIESNGPVHGVVRLQGFMADAEGKASPFRYDIRVHATAGTPRLNVLLTLVHWAERTEPLETAAPVIDVADVRVAFKTSAPSNVEFGTDAGSVTVPANEAVELLQPDDLQYVIGPPGQQVSALPKVEVNKKVEYLGEAKLATQLADPAKAHQGNDRKGTRAPGWMARQVGDKRVMLAVRYFWQNCPKSLFSTRDAMGTRLWAGEKPFDWEAGLAKTHEIVIEVQPAERAAQKNTGGQDARPPRAGRMPAPQQATGEVAASPQVVLEPLRAVIAPAWTCGTAAAGALMPRTIESLQTFPYWETWRETSMCQWANAMPAGFRDFGDGYMGGPYKGKNAYQDLEYDIPLNFLFQFIRTGQPWYLNAAEPMLRHQGDVDTDNFSGRQWKHSPQHTTNEAEFGHVFCRGLLLHYMLTGEGRSLETAMRIGDWMAPKLIRGEGVGNERQIGWSLYALSALYDITHEERYLRAAEALCKRLMDGQAPTGKFDIRWDNRIAFFNGIAMNGMLSVAEQNGDPELTQCVMKVANRTLGFYPEYITRTLNAFCWALEQTDDPRYLDAMHRTWNSTMEFVMNGHVNVESSETHMWKFPRFAARYRLFSLFNGEPPTLPDPATWHAVQLKNPEVIVHLRPAPDKTAAVLVIREGLDEGKVELLNERGEIVKTTELRNDGEYFEAAAFTLPSGGQTWTLRLTSRKAKAWQIQHDANSKLVVLDTTGVQMPYLMPRAYCYLGDGASEVKVRLEAIGEGFHSATLYDPAGRPVSAVRHFIDFGDVNRYEFELKAPLAGDAAGWSLELCKVKVLSVEGLLPYYADGAADLFNPERP